MTGSPASRDATTLGGDVEEVAAVTYVMAAIGVAGVAALLWKALAPQRPHARSVLAPDDDPEFLRGLNGKRQQPNDES
ncbi:MAG: hypothetical protein QOH09_4252 [Pseudonocardiales bacterium]|nr:hypothetical protein [Pseudonocardiales bacterium]MDT7718260.1 hypothetical protein [Pseudonocardiales bacterium]